MYADTIAVFVSIIASFLAYSIIKRSAGKLLKSWTFILLSTATLGITRILSVLYDLGMIKNIEIVKYTNILPIILLTIGFAIMLRTILSIEGKLHLDHKMKIKKRKK